MVGMLRTFEFPAVPAANDLSDLLDHGGQLQMVLPPLTATPECIRHTVVEPLLPLLTDNAFVQADIRHIVDEAASNCVKYGNGQRYSLILRVVVLSGWPALSFCLTNRASTDRGRQAAFLGWVTFDPSASDRVGQRGLFIARTMAREDGFPLQTSSRRGRNRFQVLFPLFRPVRLAAN